MPTIFEFQQCLLDNEFDYAERAVNGQVLITIKGGRMGGTIYFGYFERAESWQRAYDYFVSHKLVKSII